MCARSIESICVGRTADPDEFTIIIITEREETCVSSFSKVMTDTLLDSESQWCVAVPQRDDNNEHDRCATIMGVSVCVCVLVCLAMPRVVVHPYIRPGRMARSARRANRIILCPEMTNTHTLVRLWAKWVIIIILNFQRFLKGFFARARQGGMDGCGDGSMMVQIKFSHTWSVMMLMVAKPQITFTRAVERTDTHTCDAARDREMWVF